MSDFGRKIKIRLIEMGKNRLWLIEQVKEKTGMYFDGSYLWRIESGRNMPEKIVTAIKEILEI